MAHLSSRQASDSLEQLLTAMEPRISRILAHFSIPAPDGEDLLQDALLALVSKRNEIRDPELWLIGTLRNRCLLYWRVRRRRLYDAMDAALVEANAEPLPGDQARADLACDIETLVSKLPTRCRSIFHLRYRVGCENTEMARELGYCESSIRKITLRCLSALTKHLVAAGICEA
jgi:RNA polymerase sigma factor (sigma-70 family)